MVKDIQNQMERRHDCQGHNIRQPHQEKDAEEKWHESQQNSEQVAMPAPNQ